MTGYVRTDTTNNIADGNVISAADLDNEFNGVQAAFNSSTGHTHDGSSAEGAPITKLGPAQDVTISTTVLGVKTTNTVDLGTSSLKFKDFYLAGNASIGGTLTYGGVTLSNAVTGTGSMVLSASPTITGTITAAAANFSGAVALNGNATIGDADTDTITQAASYVTGTQLKSAKTATNTLALAAYDVDGTAYTNLITLTAANAPTLALTSTGVGTINNMSIGATTASTGAFTTLSANSTVTLSGGTINGVAYLNGSNVLTTGSVLTFDGTVVNNTGAAPNFRSTITGGSYYTNLAADGIYAVGTDLYLLAPSGKFISFYAGNSEQMRLTSTSLYTASTINVAFGTSTIGARLTTQASANSYTAGALQINSLSGTYKSYITNVGGSLLFSNSSTVDQLTLDSSGNLLVGTTSSWAGNQRFESRIGSVGFAGSFYKTDSGAGAALICRVDNTTPSLAAFYYSTNSVGAITTDGTNIALSTVSGITFPATQSASTNANTLDDYEEGTWTATLVSSGGGAVTLSSVAKYTKVGNQVLVTAEAFNISLSSLSAGSLTITGLPFTCNADSPAVAFFDIAGAVSAAQGAVVLYASNSTTMSVYLSQSTSTGITQLLKSDLNSSVSIRFNGSYLV